MVFSGKHVFFRGEHPVRPPPVFARRHSGKPLEEFGEVKFRGETESSGDLLDIHPRIDEQQRGAGKKLLLQILFRGFPEDRVKPPRKEIPGTAQHFGQILDLRLRRNLLANVTHDRFEKPPGAQIGRIAPRPVHPADLQRELLTARQPQDRIRYPENLLELPPQLRGVDHDAGSVFREHSRTGKEFQPEMDAQMLVRCRVGVAAGNSGQHQTDVVLMEDVDFAGLQVDRRGGIVGILAETGTDAEERQIVDAAVLRLLPEDVHEGKMRLHLQRRRDVVSLLFRVLSHSGHSPAEQYTQPSRRCQIFFPGATGRRFSGASD